jgi:hypothetical protein
METILPGHRMRGLGFASGGGAPPMVCLPVVDDLVLLVFGLVETIEDLLSSPPSCSLEYLEVY